MDTLFQSLADITGASIPQIRLITCFLIAYPLGNIYVRISPQSKHYFSILVSFLFFVPILNIPLAYGELLADILVTYYVANTWKGSKRMPWVVFFIIMSHLMVHHAIRVVYNTDADGSIDITGSQMVLTMKLTMFAWNVYDATRPTADLDKWQLEKRIVTFPSLIEFFGFALYFPGMLIGPSLDYAQYNDLVHETTLKHVAAETKSSRKLPSGRKRAAYQKMTRGLGFLAIYVLFGGKHGLSATLTDGFMKNPLWKRILLLQPYGFLERSKYYAVWSLTEGASVITGLGYSGIDPVTKQIRWDGAANVDIFNLEFAPNFKILLDSWNMKTNVWLRECVYKRVTPQGKKPGFRSSMMTFGTSALWHGISPGYYLTFFTGGLITTLARMLRRNVRPLLLSPRHSVLKRIYDISGTGFSILLLNYAVTPFIVLTLRDSLVAWTRVAFYGHFIVLGGLVFFYTGGGKFFRIMGMKQKEREDARNAVATEKSSGAEDNFMVPPPLDEVIPPLN